MELIQRFWDFNRVANLGSTAISMYLYLLKLGNDTDGYDVTVSDVAISNILGITRKTVKPTKEKLRSFGLIQFETKNGIPCNYRLILNYPFQIQEPEKKQKQEAKTRPQTSKKEKIETSQSVGLPVQNNPKFRVQKDEGIPTNDNTQKQLISVNVPTFEEFFKYAKNLDTYETTLDSIIKGKYQSWSNNGWKNNSGRPINNWKASLKSILPYLKNNVDNAGNEASSIESIPNIKRPKSFLND